MSAQQQAVARSLDIISNDLGITQLQARHRACTRRASAQVRLKSFDCAGGVSARSRSDEQISDTVRKRATGEPRRWNDRRERNTSCSYGERRLRNGRSGWAPRWN